MNVGGLAWRSTVVDRAALRVELGRIDGEAADLLEALRPPLAAAGCDIVRSTARRLLPVLRFEARPAHKEKSWNRFAISPLS
jgi:hypothetical protein